MTTKLADPVAEVHAAAMERRELRRNRLETRTDKEVRTAWLEGRTLPSIYAGPEIRPAETAAESWDDIVLRYGGQLNRGWPEMRLVAVIAAAAATRGDGAAVAAVKAARELDRPQQAGLFRNLQELEKDADAVRTGAARVITRCLAEWARLRLAETEREVPSGVRIG
jgi:hypothetical protein